MSEERRRILEMLAEGKITAAEAEKLLDAVAEGIPQGSLGPSRDNRAVTKPRFMRVLVEEKDGERVDIRIPLQLIRAGVKLGSLIPREAQGKVGVALAEKGINLDLGNLKPEAVEDLIDGLADLSVEVHDDEDHVRVFCE